MPTEIKLPALKENVESVEVDSVKVSQGDVVAREQPLLTVQADKATLDVPSPVAGKVARLLVKAGDVLKVGQAYCVIEEGGAGDGQKTAPKLAPAREQKAAAAGGRQSEETKEPTKSERQAVAAAVGEAPVPRREERSPAPAPATPAEVKNDREKPVLAGPATRRLARELGVDLYQVRGSGRSGRVTGEDVKAYVRDLASGATAAPAVGGTVQVPPLPRFEDWGPVDRQRLDAIRKQTAKQMALAWNLIPHVTQHDLADVTDLEAFRKQQEGKGPKLTVTAFALKACAIALRQFPKANSSLDLAAGQLVVKQYYHIGVAVDTEHGLLVPVIRDVNKKSVSELAQELTEISDRARTRQIQLEEMRGGTFTITNLGGIGGTAFTPIVNYPEVAILGMSRSRLQPVFRDGQFVPRSMLPLSLSYDHRVLDGADAARFTRRVAELLENPLQMLLHA